MRIAKRIRAFFTLLKADRELRKAVKEADRKHSKDGCRYYVIPDTRHRLRAYSWADIKRMRAAGMFSRLARQPDFIFESFYYTPGRYGHGGLDKRRMEQKRRAWLDYVAQVRRLL